MGKDEAGGKGEPVKKVKPFEPQEKGYMVIDNTVFDYIMPNLSPNAWKCLCLVMRRTKGWNKIWDDLSYSQIKEGTGIKSDPTVQRALAELIEGQYIRQTKGGKWDATKYALNTTLEIEVENGATLETIADTTIENKAEPTIESKDTILHDTQERQLPPDGGDAPAFETADSRSMTDLPEGDRQAPILFAGRTNGNHQGMDRAEGLLLRSGWNLRIKRVKDAVVYCVIATGWDIPPPGRRRLWEKDIRYQLDELHFPLDELTGYYAAAYARLADGTDKNGRRLTVPPHPGALTKTMEAIREERKRDALKQQTMEWDWK